MLNTKCLDNTLQSHPQTPKIPASSSVSPSPTIPFQNPEVKAASEFIRPIPCLQAQVHLAGVEVI